MTKAEQKIFKDLLSEIEKQNKDNSFDKLICNKGSSYSKLSDFTQLVKDEVQEIYKLNKLHKDWVSYCFTKSQSDSIMRICDALRIPYLYNYVYSDIEPSALDYVEITNKNY